MAIICYIGLGCQKDALRQPNTIYGVTSSLAKIYMCRFSPGEAFGILIFIDIYKIINLYLYKSKRWEEQVWMNEME